MEIRIRMMQGRDLFGVPVIDELRLCYLAEPSLLKDLRDINLGESRKIGDYYLYRIGNDKFEYFFLIIIEFDGAQVEIGEIKFGKYGVLDSTYLYFRIRNRILYNRALLKQALYLPELLGLFFNNFTAIDIALDHQKNFSAIIKRMMRNDRVTTILNGKAVKDRNSVIKGLFFDYSSSLSRLHNPAVTIKQAKAAKNKAKGITVQSYDKKAEILSCSGKEYILERYGCPRYLYRLEVRLNYQELRDYFKKEEKPQTLDILFDPAELLRMFYYHLGSVLRFSLGRKPLPWQDVINCNGRI